MSIHSGMIHNTAVGIVQGDDYPIGAVSEARNMVALGAELVQREPAVFFEAHKDGYISTVRNGSAPTIHTFVDGRRVESNTINKSTIVAPKAIQGVYSHGTDEFCVLYQTAANTTGDQTDIVAQVDRSTAWLQVRETPPSGTYQLEIEASAGQITRRYQITINVEGPDTITANPVVMTDVPKTVGEGENKRVNPEYEAIWLERNAIRDAELAVRRTEAAKLLSHDSLAWKIVELISESGYVKNPVVANPYVNGNANIVHLNLPNADGRNPTSVRFIKAPYWVDVLNNGEGSKSSLPQTGLEGFVYELGGGLRYQYKKSSGWEEIPGTRLKNPIKRMNMISGVEEELLFNLDPFLKDQTLFIDRAATLIGLSQRNMIHSKNGGVYVSTTTNPKLYGPVSKNIRSKADGVIIPGQSKHAWLDDDGVLVSTSSGCKFYEFGSDRVEVIATGDVDLAFRMNGSFFVVRENVLEEYQKTTASSWELAGTMVLPNSPRNVFRVVNGVLLVDGSAYFFTGKSLTGPMTFRHVNHQELRQCHGAGVSAPFRSPNTKGTMVWGMLGYAPFSETTNADIVRHIQSNQSVETSDVDFYHTEQPNDWHNISTKVVGLYTIDTKVAFRPPLLGKVFSPSSKHVVQQWTVNYVPDGGVTIGSLVKGNTRSARSFTKSRTQATHGIGVSYEDLQGIVLTQPKQQDKPRSFVVGPQSCKIQAWGNSSFGQWSQQ